MISWNITWNIVTIKIFHTDHVYVKYVKIVSCMQRDWILDCYARCVAEIELQIQPSDSSDSADENESEQVIYFTWKKVGKRVTKTQQMVSFDDAVLVKSKF